MEEELDLTWTQSIVDELESEKCAPCLPIKQLCLYCVFINGNQEAVSIQKEFVDIDENDKGTYLSEGNILQIIQKYKSENSVRYGFDCLEMFGIDMDPSQLHEFLEDHESFLHKHVYHIPQNIYIGPSVFVFHDSHCGYMYFYEMEKVTQPLVSILKKKDKKYTKKRVRISSSLPSQFTNHNNKTKKTIEIPSNEEIVKTI